MKSTKQSVKQIIYFYLYLSAFTFGGGYVIVTLMKRNLWTSITGSMMRKCWI